MTHFPKQTKNKKHVKKNFIINATCEPSSLANHYKISKPDS